MKSYFFLLLIPLLLAGCRQRGMKQTELATISIARDTLLVKHDTTATVVDTLPGVTPESPAVTTTTPPPPASKSVMASPSRRFHVIVASQPTRALAEKEVTGFRARGYPDAQIVFKDNLHYRVSIASFPTRKEALDNIPNYSRKLRVYGVWVTFY
jgi:hypothetical protein